MTTNGNSEERLALFVDHENVAIGARDIGMRFELAPLLDVLAARGRLVVRRAYADWNLFRDDRRGYVDANIELMEIPQRGDSVRKNAADIQMAVDAMELAFTRDFVSTFVIVSGDSDFTPLVSKLRELDKRVIGVGMKGSTSGMLPPACDEFIFYNRLEGAPMRSPKDHAKGRSGSDKKKGKKATEESSTGKQDLKKLERLIRRTLSGVQASGAGTVQASNLKRALLRTDPTFTEQDYGFRAFRELLNHLAESSVIEMSDGSAPGDPEIGFAPEAKDESEAFALLADVVRDLEKELGGDPPLSGLKDQIRKRAPDFSEKDFGYSGFLQFCKAAVAKNFVEMDWEEDDQEYYLYVESS
jgi:uncharacterized protein (TIGR00288 family)